MPSSPSAFSWQGSGIKQILIKHLPMTFSSILEGKRGGERRRGRGRKRRRRRRRMGRGKRRRRRRRRKKKEEQRKEEKKKGKVKEGRMGEGRRKKDVYGKTTKEISKS